MARLQDLEKLRRSLKIGDDAADEFKDVLRRIGGIIYERPSSVAVKGGLPAGQCEKQPTEMSLVMRPHDYAFAEEDKSTFRTRMCALIVRRM